MKLTKKEEEVMKIIWEIEPCLVSDIISRMDDPDIPHSTVSSVARILEKKGYVRHKSYGRVYEYYSVVKKFQYSKNRLKKMVKDYFDGSVSSLVSFLVKENELDVDELNRIIDELDKDE